MNTQLFKRKSSTFFIYGGVLIVVLFSLFVIALSAQALACSWDTCTEVPVDGYWTTQNVWVPGYTVLIKDGYWVTKSTWVPGYSVWVDTSYLKWIPGYWEGSTWIGGHTVLIKDGYWDWISGYWVTENDYWVDTSYLKWIPGEWTTKNVWVPPSTTIQCITNSQTCPTDSPGTVYSCGAIGCEATVDTTPPVSSITSPSSGSWQTGNFTVIASDSDSGGAGLDTCYYKVFDSLAGWTKNETVRSCNSSFSVSVGPSADCRTQGSNRCTVYAYAKDTLGNVDSLSTAKGFSIDYTGPSIGNITPSTSVQGVGTVFSTSVSDTNPIVSCSSLADSGPGTPVLNVGTTTLSPSPCPAGSTCTASITRAPFQTHTLYIDCTDSLGLQSTSSGTTITVQTCPYLATAPSDTFSVGTCNVTVTGKAWDLNTSSIRGYESAAAGSAFRTLRVSDNPLQCSDNVKFTNSWVVNGNSVDITTSTSILGTTTNTFDAGFTIGVTGPNCSISYPGITGTTTNTDVRMVKGVNKNNDPKSTVTTFTINSDSNPPVITILNTSDELMWHSGGPALSLNFFDEGILDSVQYKIGDIGAWTNVPGFSNTGSGNYTKIFTIDDTNPDWQALPDGLNKRIYIRSTDINGNCSGCDGTKYFSVKKDTTAPTEANSLVANSNSGINLDFTTPGKNHWINDKGFTFNPSEIDTLSGMASCSYRLQSSLGGFVSNVYTCNSIPLNIPIASVCTVEGIGKCTIFFTITDQAGNNITTSRPLDIDRTSPK